MVKNKMVNRLVSLLCALFLLVSSVLVPCVPSYAAVAPAVDVGEGLTYLFQMLSSSLGSAVSKASVPSLYLAVDAYSKASDPAYMAQLREYYKDDSLVRSEPIDTGFCNWLLGAIKDVFVSSGDYGSEGADITEYKVSVPVYGDATYMPEQTSFDFYYANGVNRLTFTVPADCYMLPYTSVVDGRSSFIIGLMSEKPFTCSWYSYVTNDSYEKESVTMQLDGRGLYYYQLYKASSTSGDIDKFLSSISIPYPISRVWYNPLVTTDVSILLDKALAEIQAQAFVKTPAITAPISIPADTAAMEKNAKAVAAADNADALYKALAAAGIAIGVDVDVPDETDKPTDAEIPDDGSSAIGKQLSAIYEGILGLADKVGSIPAQIENFFTIDTDAIGDSFMGLKDAFSSRFEVLKAFGTIFDNLSYTLKDTPPIIKFRVPPDLVRYFGSEEVVAMDLTAYADYCSLIRTAVQCLLWFGFVLALLDEFDIKFNVA